MNLGGLTLEQTPPLGVPLRYFMTAPLFALLAGGWWLWHYETILAAPLSPKR